MSWTDLATVRKHLQRPSTVNAAIENEKHILVGTNTVQLEHNSLVTDTEKIKTIDLATPHSEGGKVFSGTQYVFMTHQELAPESVVVADQTVDTIYTEGVDYVVDYDQGKIKRTSTSSIPDGGTAYIWYFYFTVHDKDVDYQIDYDAGQITRIATGSIADGATVHVDYSTSMGTITDELINQAIIEAEDKISARLKEGYDASSTDQGLKTGATELALAIICNAKAMDMMLQRPSDDADGTAEQWRKISRRYEKQAWQTLDRFLKARSRRSTISETNSSWELFSK